MRTRTVSHSSLLPGFRTWGLIGRAALAVAVLSPIFFLSGCMTPEDKAFYGRGWINPSELDQDAESEDNADPTAITPHMMGPGNY